MPSRITKGCAGAVLAAMLFGVPTAARAAIEFADVVGPGTFGFLNSNTGDVLNLPYGGYVPGSAGFHFPIEVPLSVVLGPDPSNPQFSDPNTSKISFLSLPTGSYVTVGFVGKIIVDIPQQPDIFFTEIGGNGEQANISVSADGVNFTFLASLTANNVDGDANTTFALDLATIGWSSALWIRVAGTSLGGASAGFDLANVSAQVAPQPSLPVDVVPEPASLAIWSLSIVAAGVLRRRHSRAHHV